MLWLLDAGLPVLVVPASRCRRTLGRTELMGSGAELCPDRVPTASVNSVRTELTD